MKRRIVLGVIVAVGALSLAGAAYQQRGPQGPKIAEIEKVKDNLYMITGGGGNTAAFITSNGVAVCNTTASVVQDVVATCGHTTVDVTLAQQTDGSITGQLVTKAAGQ